MAKKRMTPRRPGGAAGIETIEEVQEIGNGLPVDEANYTASDDANHPDRNGKATKSERKAKAAKAKSESPAHDHFGVGDIRKAAAFANSIGGLDKAIALLQILKVAKDVQ